MKFKTPLLLCILCALNSCAWIEYLKTSTVQSEKASSYIAESGPERVRFPSNDADLAGGSPSIIDGYLFKPAGQGPCPALPLSPCTAVRDCSPRQAGFIGGIGTGPSVCRVLGMWFCFLTA